MNADSPTRRLAALPVPRRGVVAALAVVAAAVRLPLFLASRHVSFDDGVFGLSAVAMRHGGEPFRDVFSSQGPLFLPLVWLGDLLGLRTANAPRMVAMVSGLVVTVLVFVVARRLVGPGCAVVAALVVTVSGSVLWVTGPLAADGPTLALGLGAVAVALAYRDDPSPGKALAMGLLAGGAFAVKSLFAVPPGVVVAWAFLEHRRWGELGLGVAASTVVVVGASVPWGLGDVWDQSVDYHLDATGGRTPVANFTKVWSTLWDRDLLVLVALAVGSTVAAVRRFSGFEARRMAPVLAWLAAVFVVFVAEHPLWRPHVAHVVPPLAVVAVWMGRPHLRVMGAVVAVGAVAHVAATADILWPGSYPPAEAAAVRDLEALDDGDLVVTDEPGLVWRAGLRSPPGLVDASILQIESGRITAERLEEAVTGDGDGDDPVCAVLVWSTRYGRFELAERLSDDGYRVDETYGDDDERRLLTRRCAPAGRGSATAEPARSPG